MASLVLKQIERGSVSFASSDTTKTVTLSTTLSDTTKTVLLFSAKSGSADPIDFQILGRVLSTTQIQFERQATPDEAADVEYQVVEFTQGITVQHIYQTSLTSTTTNITISAVTLSKAFPIISFKTSGGTLGADDLWNAEITTTTNLQLTASAGGSNNAVAAQIVEIDDATVQLIDDTYGTGATKDITVSSITENKTFWVFTSSSPSNITFDNIPYLSYVNATTLRFTRSVSTGLDLPFKVYVVSLSAGITVRNISTVVPSSSTTVSPTITSITVANTVLLVNGIYQRFASANASNDDAGGGMLALSGLTTTSFTATRTDSPALSATTNVQVLEFAITVPVFPDDWDSKLRITSKGTYVDEDLANFPCLIDENQVNPDFWENVQDGGGDIRCTTDEEGASQIPIEVVKCDTDTKELILFVKRNIDADGGDPVYIWYNPTNPAISETAASTYGRNNVWTDYEAVYHLEEGSGAAVDSTGSHDGTYNGTAPSPRNPDGQVGQANDFEYDNANYISLPDESDFDFTTSVTVEAWIKVESFPAIWSAIVAKGDTAWRLHRYSNTNYISFGTSGLVVVDTPTTTDINDGELHYVAGRYDGTNVSTFTDGIKEGDAVVGSGTISTNDNVVTIGRNALTVDRDWDGLIDEVRISGTAHSDAWIKASAYNQLLTTNLWWGASEVSVTVIQDFL